MDADQEVIGLSIALPADEPLDVASMTYQPGSEGPWLTMVDISAAGIDRAELLRRVERLGLELVKQARTPAGA